MSFFPLVVASASRSRQRVLEEAGLTFVVDPADIDEGAIKAEAIRKHWSPSVTALTLAEAKANVVAARHPGARVIAADQLLVFGDRFLDKPTSIVDARTALQRLRGERHRLVSAVVIVQDSICRWRYAETAHLRMRDFSDAFLDRYLAICGEAVTTSVGGYQLEGMGAQLFTEIDGDFFTILGIPLLPLLEALRREDVLPR